ncbi:hypothetical protein H1R20_g686, partial [Candolleomyces eurysporus]
MGQAIAAARKLVGDSADENKQKTLEQLTFLVKAANSKLDLYQNELDAMFTDPRTVNKRMIPGMRAMRWERGYRVGVQTDSAEGGLGDIINSTFGIIEDASGDKGGPEKNKAIIDGFRKVVFGALTAIIGNTDAGEQEEQKFFIFVKHNAIIRIDIWRYNFSSKDIIATHENVFCYVFCTSVVNSAALHYDEITYLLSEYAGDQGVDAYVKSLLEVWKSIGQMHSFLQTRKEGKDEEDEEDEEDGKDEKDEKKPKVNGRLALPSAPKNKLEDGERHKEEEQLPDA